MDKSKIICLVSPLIVQDAFSVPATFTQLSEEFSEEILIQTFIDPTVEQNQAFFNTCFKPDVYLQNQTFHVDTTLFTN